VSLKSLLVAILTCLSFDVGATAAQAMPFRSAQTRSAIPVSSGCGIGVNRGSYDGCDVIYHGDYRARDYVHHRARLKHKLDEMPGSIKAAADKATAKTAADKAETERYAAKTAADKAAADKLAAQAAAGKAAAKKLAGEKAAADKATADKLPMSSGEPKTRVTPSAPMPPVLAHDRYQGESGHRN
jgi:hypothetical protein